MLPLPALMHAVGPPLTPQGLRDLQAADGLHGQQLAQQPAGLATVAVWEREHLHLLQVRFRATGRDRLAGLLLRVSSRRACWCTRCPGASSLTRTSNGRRYHRILFERLCTARKCVAAKCAAAAANSGRAARSEGVSGAVTPELSVGSSTIRSAALVCRQAAPLFPAIAEYRNGMVFRCGPSLCLY